jgi:hypothetical protein
MIKVGARQNCKALLRRLSTGNDQARPRATWIAVLPFDLRCATPVLPIAIGRTSLVTPSTASQTSVQGTSAPDRQSQNPHSV